MVIARPLRGVLVAFVVSTALVLFARSQPVPERPDVITVEAITAPPDPCVVWVPGSEPNTLRMGPAPAGR